MWGPGREFGSDRQRALERGAQDGLLGLVGRGLTLRCKVTCPRVVLGAGHLTPCGVRNTWRQGRNEREGRGRRAGWRLHSTVDSQATRCSLDRQREDSQSRDSKPHGMKEHPRTQAAGRGGGHRARVSLSGPRRYVFQGHAAPVTAGQLCPRVCGRPQPVCKQERGCSQENCAEQVPGGARPVSCSLLRPLASLAVTPTRHGVRGGRHGSERREREPGCARAGVWGAGEPVRGRPPVVLPGKPSLAPPPCTSPIPSPLGS